MTTTAAAFARVAHVLDGTDATDPAAVEHFYRRVFTAYPPQTRALISDFLIGLPNPSDEDLAKLKHVVDTPVAQMPRVAAPAWDERHGPPLEYSAAQPDEPPGEPVELAATTARPARRTARTPRLGADRTATPA